MKTNDDAPLNASERDALTAAGIELFTEHARRGDLSMVSLGLLADLLIAQSPVHDSSFEIEEEYHFGEALPFTIKQNGVPILAIVGWGQPTMGPTARDRAFAHIVVRALKQMGQLEAIRAAVLEHDDRLNNGIGDEGQQPPTGDDYNTLFRLIIDGVPVAKPRVPVIKGEGFNRMGGGFASLIVDGVSYTAKQIGQAIKSMEDKGWQS